MKLTKKIFEIFFLVFTISMQAQLQLDAELRPRFEYRRGFKTLFPNEAKAATFVSQRTRLNAGFKMEKLNFYLSLQDVRVWGDVPQLNTSDNNGTAIHQAWGELLFTPNYSVKVGRQEVIYDDQRIFGNVGWAQQARSHDAAILKYNKSSLRMDLGFAFNENKENLVDVPYTGSYKSFQYLWMHKEWTNFSGSFLFLNNGVQFIDEQSASNSETRFSQTVGTHLKLKQNKLSGTANLFYQFGKDIGDNSIGAYLLGLEAAYKTSKRSLVALGAELQSGNDNGVLEDNENNAFTPLYGTNHKFNGFMDYFYVGNHLNNVGLLDVYAKAKVAIGSKSSVTGFVHSFSAAADINDDVSKVLGTEIDLVFGYSMSKQIKINAGYSHLFASEGMEVLKGNMDGNTNNWGWLMVTINPTLYKGQKKSLKDNKVDKT